MHPIQRIVARVYFTAVGIVDVLRGDEYAKRYWPPYVIVNEAYPQTEMYDLVEPRVAMNAGVGDILETRHGAYVVRCRTWDRRGRLLLTVKNTHPCC